MDFELPAEHPARTAVREWIAAHPEPSPRDLADAGYVVPHWPKPWGLDADPIEQLLISDELKRANISRPINPIGIGHCGPILVIHGIGRAEAALHPADAGRGRDLVPAVQRTGSRLGSRRRVDTRREDGRRLGRQRTEGLDVPRAPGELRHPPRTHEPGRPEAPGPVVLPDRHEDAGRSTSVRWWR